MTRSSTAAEQDPSARGTDPIGDAPVGDAPGLTPPVGRGERIRSAIARPTPWTAVIVGVMAVAFDVAVHHPVASVASSLLVLVVVIGVFASGRARNLQVIAPAVLAVTVGAFLSLRVSPWVVPLDGVGVLAMVLLVAGYAAGGGMASASASSLLGQALRAALSLVLAPAFLAGCVAALIPTRNERSRRRLVAVGRGVGLAVPVVVVLALLLASADAVFASIFSLPTDLGSVSRHVAVAGVGAVVASALLVDVSLPPFESRSAAVTPLGTTEASVVLGSIAVLYALFAGAQVIAARGGADHVIETSGLTYADYARGGFFQLLGVAALTLAVVCGLRVVTRRESSGRQVVVAALGEAVVVLTLVIVGVAIHRLGLYEDEFGATMLRLSSTVFAWWLGVVFVLVALALAGVGARRTWLPAAVVTSALVALLAWNVVNPEQHVVERNVARYERVGSLDTEYLWSLSDDAVPAMAAMLPRLDPETHDAVLRRVCSIPTPDNRRPARLRSGSQDLVPPEAGGLAVHGGAVPPGSVPSGGLGSNRSAHLAAAARSEVCPR